MNSHVCRRTDLKRCAFTGYRPTKMPFGYDENDPACIALKQELYQEIENLTGQGYAYYLSGGAMAGNTWAAEAVLDLREKYPWIVLDIRRWNCDHC